MENVLTTILSSSIIATLVAGIATKITEGRIQSTFDKKLESVKKEHTLEIAKFQSELDSLKAKENFKFTKLHEERFKVLKETYALLNKTRNSLALFVAEIKLISNSTTFEKNEERLHMNFIASHEEFVKYIDDNLIFFSSNLESMLAEFIEESFQISVDYNPNHPINKLVFPNKEVKKNAVSAYKRLNDNIQPIMITIKKECRTILGADL
ncbi:hypothetical protein [Flavobacterium nitrogenifigens]|uniref:Uncharacterized protein n=1 Tax=Flavobacterium nitrogenifigens TaxID=1617283 RepID=A0A521AEN9_9FLAO|nr:hypothetical protein [Flavobacterium nitrogenifigens]KAF2331474.1 hypothetical protein DM397_12110 [Flavobacterium nitrogenifigens]SMO33258.1 hypothetical protein SAMN06265220_10170 [Flavobacterium nitrogenifigens]